mmetsp:Transcript_13783/g.26743  ORF Transcript_13783/g.26743 Transcript_13783/m.26743 type:complete len:343 (-) Transcript_13783:71-1099(-)
MEVAEDVRKDLYANALEHLVEHLQKNTCVQNIDMMSISGFCRNCLSKWIFRAAKENGVDITYEQALEEIYGMPYNDWKTKFQTKATQAQLEALEASKGFQAQHPADLDVKKTSLGQPGSVAPRQSSFVPQAISSSSGPIMSDVCCQDPNAVGADAESMIKQMKCIPNPLHGSSQSPEEIPIMRLGVLTVSDRASQGVYEDLSGPEVEKCVSLFANTYKLIKIVDSPSKLLVPDEAEKISEALIKLSTTCDVILTTGGTGLSPRDVTPEATLKVIQREIRGIPESIRRETSKVEPLAMLSRAVAGIRDNRTLIVNLPGRPKAVREALEVFLPALPHILSQLHP